MNKRGREGRTMNEERKTQVITLLASIYEMIFVEWVGDGSKRGYVLRKVKDKTLFDSVPRIMEDLESLLKSDMSDENSIYLGEIILAYREHGISERLITILADTLMRNSTIQKRFAKSPLYSVLTELLKNKQRSGISSRSAFSNDSFS